MKAFFVICVVLVAGIHAANLNLHPSVLDEKAVECIKETGVSVDVVNAAIDGRVTDEKGVMKFMYCFLHKAELVDDEGKLDVEKALTKLPAGIDKDEAKKALRSCKRQSIWKV